MSVYGLLSRGAYELRKVGMKEKNLGTRCKSSCENTRCFYLEVFKWTLFRKEINTS